jgi:hypothetical protein
VSFYEGEIMNKLFYIRFYSHARNCHERVLWSASSREAVEQMAMDYEKESSFRAEVIRFVCITPDEVGEEL